MTRPKTEHVTRQHGFSIVELMLVVLIMSIITLIALPAYQDYSTRARVSDMVIAVAGIKNDIAEFYLFNNAWPVDNTEAGISDPSAYANDGVQTVTVNNGDIIIVSDVPTLEGETIIFSPTFAGNRVSWDCTGGTLDPRFRPSNCRL